MPNQKSQLASLIGQVIPRGGEGQGSRFTILALSIFIGLVVGIFAFKAARQKRKAAKLGHEVRTLKLKEDQAAYKRIMAEKEEDKKLVDIQLQSIQTEIDAKKSEIKVLHEDHEKFTKDLADLTSWDEVNIV